MKDTIDLLDYEIYPLIQKKSDIAFPEFGFIRKNNGWEATKGEIKGEKAKGHLYHYDNTLFCFKNHKTGEVITLWSYIQTSKGLSKQETLLELARLANVTLPRLKGYSEVKAVIARKRAKILEIALDFCKTQLWIGEGKKTLKYLMDRGYSEEEIKSMELGFFPSQKNVETYLLKKDYNKNDIYSMGLNTRGFGTTHKVVIPYRDPVGRLKGFTVRAIKDEVKPKYLNSSKLRRDTLFNLNAARGEKDLIVVESYLDALISTLRGIRGVVAIGGSSITEKQLETATRYGAKRFILAFDNDKSGRDGTERSLDLIKKQRLKTYVVTLPEGYDPDDLMREKGVDAFKKDIKEARSGVKWKAKRILMKHDLETDRGRDDAIEEALVYEETIIDPSGSKDFIDTITVDMEIPSQILESKIKDYHKKKAQERLISRSKRLFREGLRIAEEGKIGSLREFINKNLIVLKRESEYRIKRYGFKELERDIIETPEGLRTGYKRIDSIIRIPQEAITIVAGRPSHGKTTFLFNLLLNMIEEYPEKTFAFFSYEENKRKIGLKLLNILSGKVIDEKQNNLKQIEYYIKGGNNSIPEIERGKERFEDLVESGRLLISDEPFYVDKLNDILAYLKEKYKTLGAVFIDYFQKVKIKRKFNTRQLEIQKISEQILETAKSLSLPIILGAQVNREVKSLRDLTLDKLREAGDLEQDASLILGLYNNAMERTEEDKDEEKNPVVDLNLIILKNRDGIVNENIDLFFNTPILTISDEPPKQEGWS